MVLGAWRRVSQGELRAPGRATVPLCCRAATAIWDSGALRPPSSRERGPTTASALPCVRPERVHQRREDDKNVVQRRGGERGRGPLARNRRGLLPQILVAVDGSADAAAALRHATTLALDQHAPRRRRAALDVGVETRIARGRPARAIVEIAHGVVAMHGPP